MRSLSCFSRGDVDYTTEPRYRARFLQFRREGTFYLPWSWDEVIYGSVGVLSLRHGVLSPPATIFRCSRPMRNIRPRLTRTLLPRSSIDVPRTFSWLYTSIHVLNKAPQTALIKDTQASDDFADAKQLLLDTHGRAIMHAVLVGFAGVAPKSAVPNLVELFSALVVKTPLESKRWILEILYGVRGCFISCLCVLH